MATRAQQIAALQDDWDSNPRWIGVSRRYSAADVVRLRGSLNIEHTLAQLGAGKLWRLLHAEAFVGALGAVVGDQAVQQVQAGLKAIYLPDATQLRGAHQALQRADQHQWSAGRDEIDYFVPIVADAEAGSTGLSDAYALTRAMIEAGAAGVHLGDQLADKVLLPTRAAIDKLSAARLAADVTGVPALLIASTGADAADWLSSDVDDYDHPFRTGERSVEGYYKVRNGLQLAIARGLAYAPHADLLCLETARPDLAGAQTFAAAVHASFPGKLLAYHCAPSFSWKQNLDDATIARFQKELGAMGYKFQFIAQAGLHALNHSMFKLAHGYARRQMPAFVELQEAEFAAARQGYTAPSITASQGWIEEQGLFDKKVA